MTRSLPLWIGKTDDEPIPPRVKLRVFERYGGICQLTGRKIRPGDSWQADHRIALINGGKNAEDNLWPVLTEAHKAKTAEDVKIKSKVARMKAKHLGIYPRSRAKFPNRPFPKSRGINYGSE